MRDAYVAPELTPAEATPQRVREELVVALMNAFGTVPRIPNASPNPIQLRNDVERFVRRAFEDLGADYESPTPQALRSVLERFRQQGGSFIPDATQIQHHWNEMSKLVGQLA